MELIINNTRVTLVKGDITRQDTEAIVNAANSSLLGGGGVDGAIHRTGGPGILEECRRIVSVIGRLPAGQAVITGGGRLKARYVIHTVGPIWRGGDKGEEQLLRNAYHNSLKLAVEKGIGSISFPSISTGAYRFPIELAAGIAVDTVRAFVRENQLQEIRFVLFSQGDYKVYEEAWGRSL